MAGMPGLSITALCILIPCYQSLVLSGHGPSPRLSFEQWEKRLLSNSVAVPSNKLGKRMPVMSHFATNNLQQPTEAVFDPKQCPEKPVDQPPFIFEFGWEINIAVPHAYFLFRCGKLQSTKSCNADFSAYYWFSPNHTVVECGPLAGFVTDDKFEGIRCGDYLSDMPVPQWYPPPHAAFYRQRSITWPGQKQTGILLLNKNNHGGLQMNGGFIDGPTLSRVMEAFHQQCPDTEIMYYRDWQFKDLDLSWERETDNGALNSDLEAKALAKNPNARRIQDLPAQSEDPREAQMLVWSRFSCFLTVHGGNTELASNFGGRMLTYIRGIDWYNNEMTQKRLTGLAETSIKRVSDDDELLNGLSFLTEGGCGQCSMKAMGGT